MKSTEVIVKVVCTHASFIVMIIIIIIIIILITRIILYYNCFFFIHVFIINDNYLLTMEAKVIQQTV